MVRALVATAIFAALAGCRPYDLHDRLTDQGGVVPASQYARYGREQAQAIAIGRSLAQWYGGQSAEARLTQVREAARYAGTLPDVATVVPDSLGYRLTVTFKSGWVTAIVPVDDGVRPEDTPGLPGTQ